MPSFISKNGIWEPAQEKAFDPKTGDMYIGPDREAKKYIEENGGMVGMKSSEDPQIIEIAENRRMTVEQWMEKNAPKIEQVEAKKIADEQVVTHTPGPKKRGVKPSKGGFYDPSTETPEEKMKAQ